MWIRKVNKIPVPRAREIIPVFITLLSICCLKPSSAARLSFTIANISTENVDIKGLFKLRYDPPIGIPLHNKTYSASEIFNTTHTFSSLLPGTKYNFRLQSVNRNTSLLLSSLETNSVANNNTAFVSKNDSLSIWNATYMTAPYPPKNITFSYTNESVRIAWNPPEVGGVTQYRLRIQSFAKEDENKPDKNYTANGASHEIRDFLPGITYRVKIWSVFNDVESSGYTSKNFTTKPNSPELIIMWYRNETSLFTMWNSPDPPGLFSGFQVSINPKDGAKNLFIPKDGPGTAQAVFNNLVPGRLYNISIKTVSKGQYSKPVFAQYRTVPKRPKNMTVDPDALTPHTAEISWDSPTGEYDRYQLQIKEELGELKSTKIFVPKDSSTTVMFEDLVANRTYRVIAQTMSGLVASWPSTLHFTTKAETDSNNGTKVKPPTATTSSTPLIQNNQFANLTTFSTTGKPINVNSTGGTTTIRSTIIANNNVTSTLIKSPSIS